MGPLPPSLCSSSRDGSPDVFQRQSRSLNNNSVLDDTLTSFGTSTPTGSIENSESHNPCTEWKLRPMQQPLAVLTHTCTWIHTAHARTHTHICCHNYGGAACLDPGHFNFLRFHFHCTCPFLEFSSALIHGFITHRLLLTSSQLTIAKTGLYSQHI